MAEDRIDALDANAELLALALDGHGEVRISMIVRLTMLSRICEHDPDEFTTISYVESHKLPD